VEGALAEIAEIDKSMPDRSFAFILGAGASVSSGISSGSELARQWLKQLHLRECLDGSDLETWLNSGETGIEGFDPDNVGAAYPDIFERRFGGDPEAGYRDLEKEMEGRRPSLGYSMLAEIMGKTRHRIVVTTNFDNLVAEAMALHEHTVPLIVGHESLAGFARPKIGRPLIAKIHRDLLFEPINDSEGTDNLKKNWVAALRNLFQHHTPIFIGYGGNDGSLMGFLDGLSAKDISGRMIWCHRSGSLPPEKAIRLSGKHPIAFVSISGFDEFIYSLCRELLPKFDPSEISVRLEKLGVTRADHFGRQVTEFREQLAQGNPDQQRGAKSLADASRDEHVWLTWALRAHTENDPNKQKEIYQEGLNRVVDSPELAIHYALFLAYQGKDLDAAEKMYKRALALAPEEASYIYNYALFLAYEKKDFDAAEKMYWRTLELDPDDAVYKSSYATFLANRRKDFDGAEALFEQALELDASDFNIAANYAGMILARGSDDVVAAKALALQAVGIDGPKILQTHAEALLYLALCSELLGDNPMPALARLKKVVGDGYMRGRWDFTGLFKTVLPKVREHRRALYEAIGVAILDEEKVAALEKFEEWNKLKPSDGIPTDEA